MKNISIFVLFTLLLGITGGIIGAYIMFTLQDTQNNRIKNAYAQEMAIVVSPHTVKGLIDKKDKNYILVDLRTAQEYNKEHIITAMNIPAVSMNQDQIVASFRKLPENKQIIVQCYSASCTLGRKVGNILAQNGIYVQEMNVGWNEWRYHWDHWNPGEKPLDGMKYIVSGAADANNTFILPCTVGEFSC